MEVRGLGIIDVKLLFGIGSILNASRIELVVYLQQWEPTTQYERVGMDLKTSKILDVEIPTVHIPVSPGRNLAVLIEVAALNQRLRGQGYVSALTFNQSLIERMKKPAK